jgi:hypothetical protein
MEAERYFGGSFDVDGLAADTIRGSLEAAADLAEARGLGRPGVTLDPRHAAAAFTSERHIVAPGLEGDGFGPLSRFARTRDGWIRLHANYPHHREALLRALGRPEDVLGAIGEREAVELEAAIVAEGGCAAAVRDAAAWRAHPQGAAVEALELWDAEVAAEASRPLGAAPDGERLPAAGVRVLDLTRVIAGPVGTRMLAALGADVLRIDPPGMPELPLHVIDGWPGKRSALLDLRSERETVERLLDGADVVVQGYRPGALARVGLGRDELAARHPHLVVVELSAWGHIGPWSERRGFDSLVQAACGIAVAEGRDGAPGALPAQALDHATGYLIARLALEGLAERARTGRATRARVGLARTAAHLMRRRAPDGPVRELDAAPFLQEVGGAVSLVRPPGELDGEPLCWPSGPPRPGKHAPAWA